MLKNLVHLEVKKQEREYFFGCDPQAPLGEIYDALCEMQKYIADRINQSIPKREDEQKKECCEQECEDAASKASA